MDKVLLGSQDIKSLFEWRDAHKDEVRTNPSPVRDIEIICKESQVKVKCIREPQKLKMWVNIGGKSMGHAEFTLASTGMWHSEKNKLKLQQEDIQSCLSLYCSIVALMVYGTMEEVSLPERRKQMEKLEAMKSERSKQEAAPTYYIVGALLYMLAEGVLTLARKVSSAFAAIIATTLRHQKLFTASFDTVMSIDIELDGEEYTFSYDLPEEEDAEGKWVYQEEEFDIYNLRTALRSLSAVSFTEEQPEGQEEIKITIHLDNAYFPTFVLSIYRYDGTNCIAEVDGVPTAFVSRSQTVNLIEAVNGLILGAA